MQAQEAASNSSESNISECPESFARWYCLNGASCFTVKIQESVLYNCWCPLGFHGLRCDYKYSSTTTRNQQQQQQQQQAQSQNYRQSDQWGAVSQLGSSSDIKSADNSIRTGQQRQSSSSDSDLDGRAIYLISVYILAVTFLIIILIVLLIQILKRKQSTMSDVNHNSNIGDGDNNNNSSNRLQANWNNEQINHLRGKRPGQHKQQGLQSQLQVASVSLELDHIFKQELERRLRIQRNLNESKRNETTDRTTTMDCISGATARKQRIRQLNEHSKREAAVGHSGRQRPVKQQQQSPSTGNKSNTDQSGIISDHQQRPASSAASSSSSSSPLEPVWIC